MTPTNISHDSNKSCRTGSDQSTRDNHGQVRAKASVARVNGDGTGGVSTAAVEDVAEVAADLWGAPAAALDPSRLPIDAENKRVRVMSSLLGTSPRSVECDGDDDNDDGDDEADEKSRAAERAKN